MEANLPNNAAAEFLGVAPQTVRKWRHLGRGPAFIRLGDSMKSRVVYDPAVLRAWIDARRFQHTTEETAGKLGPSGRRS